MLRRITDLWPGLLRRAQSDDEGDNDALLDPEQPGGDSDGDQVAREEQLLQDYRLLYWTRLMVIDGYEPDHDRKWPLGPDVVEECRAVDRLHPGNED